MLRRRSSQAVKVAVVGSHDLDPALIASHLLKQLVSLPTPSIVMLRRGRKTKPGPIEMLTESLCRQLEIAVEWREPQAGARAGVYNRDVSMVGACDAVWAYFDPEHVMEGGTGHVVEKALDQDRPVYAWAPIDGSMTDVGSHEPAPA